MVTVIIPTFNRAGKIEKAIESVLAQTYQDWTMIVVDDASTDDTQAVVRGMKDERIRYVRNEINRGPSYSRNTGAELARTKYLAFQDSDTVWHPQKLEKQIRLLEKGECRVAYHSYRLNHHVYPEPEIPLKEKQGMIYPYLLHCPMIGTPCMLAERRIFRELGGFCEKLRCLEDYELSLRMAQRIPIGFLDEVLLTAEDNENSVSKNAEQEIKALFYIMEHYHDDFQKFLLAKKLHFNRISALAKETGMMQLYYEKLEIYMKRTGQQIEDLMKMYEVVL